MVWGREVEEMEKEYGRLKEMGGEVYCVRSDRELSEKGWEEECEGMRKME